jgi:methionine biosynthesis protein MetW
VLLGRMPVSSSLPYQWYDTPNIHLCTVADFDAFCAAHRFHVLERVVLHDARRVNVLPNLLGSLAIYRFRRN